MKIKKTELESLIKEALIAEAAGKLNEQELQELLGGLKGLFGAGAGAAKKAGKAVAGAANAGVGMVKKGVQAASGAVDKAASAASGAIGKAGQAVAGAYQQGEKQAAVGTVKKSIEKVISTVDAAMPKVASDPKTQHDLENVKAAVAQTLHIFMEKRQKDQEPKRKSLKESGKWVQKNKK